MCVCKWNNDLRRCLLVTAAPWWTDCLLLLPGRSPQEAQTARRCPGRSRVPLTWGTRITRERWGLRTWRGIRSTSWLSERQRENFCGTVRDDRGRCPSSHFINMLVLCVWSRLTSPWLALFPGCPCWPPPFPWKHEINGKPGSLYSFYFHFYGSCLESRRYINQDAFGDLGALTLGFFQSPSPAGSLVSLALPSWPETDRITLVTYQ